MQQVKQAKGPNVVKFPPKKIQNRKLALSNNALRARGDAKVMAKGHNPGSAVHLEARRREMVAVDLRLKGYDYKEIGEQMGLSEVGAYQIVMRVLDAYQEDIKEKIPQVRQIEERRLDRMWKGIEARANSGDPKAVMAGLKIQERRSRLKGLDAPLKIAQTDVEGNDLIKKPDEIIDQEIEALTITLSKAPSGEYGKEVEAPCGE